VTTSEPYDCGAGFNNWVAGWSEAKKKMVLRSQANGMYDHHHFTDYHNIQLQF